jgi:histidine phosphotransferase ChpT
MLPQGFGGFLAPRDSSCNRSNGAMAQHMRGGHLRGWILKLGGRKFMAAELELSDLELAALVSSKICHDIISPVGAIANGLEVMDEETDQVMQDHAMALIRSSAAQASAKLQFARLAFGAAGSAGAEIDVLEAEKVARMVAEAGKHTLEWNGPPARLAKDMVKLLLNMVTLGLAALPRGGALKVSIAGEGDASSFELRCEGDSARIPEKLAEFMAGSTELALDAHSIQPFFTLRIARAAGMSLKVENDGSDIVFSATNTS